MLNPYLTESVKAFWTPWNRFILTDTNKLYFFLLFHFTRLSWLKKKIPLPTTKKQPSKKKTQPNLSTSLKPLLSSEKISAPFLPNELKECHKKHSWASKWLRVYDGLKISAVQSTHTSISLMQDTYKWET